MAVDRRLMFIDALASSSSKPTRRRRGSARCYGPPCEIKGCTGRTVGNKPYCLEHVQLMPYAAKIQDREEAREREIESKSGAPIDGFVAQDLMGAIKLNQSSIPALARDLRVPHDVVEALVHHLVKAKLVTIRRSKRSVYVKRVPEGKAPPEGDQGPKDESRK